VPVHRRIVACTRCPRLRAHCARVAREKRAAFGDEVYWGKPVPGYGDPRARVLVLGLAPAAHGSNRTARMFTGDGTGGSGDFLVQAMHAHGFASGTTSARADDGLRLKDAFITAVARCAPPDNRPTTAEIASCHAHLVDELALLPRVRVIVALGRVAFDACWRLAADRGVAPKPRPRFGHGLVYRVDGMPAVLASFHPSRQNTNTGKLTPAMLADVFAAAREIAATPPARPRGRRPRRARPSSAT
jgi:uracil-DNA glycosylase family 4